MNQHGVKIHNYTFLKILTISLRIISFCTKIYSCLIYVIFPQCATEFKGSARIFPKSSAESVSSSISPMTATLSPLTMYNPSTTCSTPCEELNTRSWLSSSIKLMVWSKPFSVPCKENIQEKKDKVSEYVNSTTPF